MSRVGKWYLGGSCNLWKGELERAIVCVAGIWIAASHPANRKRTRCKDKQRNSRTPWMMFAFYVGSARIFRIIAYFDRFNPVSRLVTKTVELCTSNSPSLPAVNRKTGA